MATIKTRDGIEIYYKDWGKGQPIVFSHGWPLSADDWDAQMLFFLNQGHRVIAHDRRGHGRSSQAADGHDVEHYASDLAAWPILAVFLKRSLTDFRRRSRPIARNSIATWRPVRSTATTGLAPKPRRPSSRTGGARG